MAQIEMSGHLNRAIVEDGRIANISISHLRRDGFAGWRLGFGQIGAFDSRFGMEFQVSSCNKIDSLLR